MRKSNKIFRWTLLGFIVLVILYFILSIFWEVDRSKYERFYGVKIDKNNRYIYFISQLNGISYLCRYLIEDNKLEIIERSAPDKFWYTLSISPSGNKIAFVEKGYNNFENTTIKIYDIEDNVFTNNIKYDSIIILSVMYYYDDDLMYFTGANFWGKNSLIARSRPKGIDIYRLLVRDNIIRKITNFNNYALGEIKTFRYDTIFLSHFTNSEVEIGKISIHNPDTIYNYNINIFNRDSNYVHLFGKQVYSSILNNIVFSCQLFIWYMDPDSAIAYKLCDLPEEYDSVDDIEFYKDSSVFIFTSSKNPYMIYQYDLEKKQMLPPIRISYPIETMKP